jgi:ATP-dependent protease HslVU (ClpYQ) peptidase subunit
MTIIAAMNEPDVGTWIGADSLVSGGDGVVCGHQDKWFKGLGFALAVSGSNAAATVIRDTITEVENWWQPSKLWVWTVDLLRYYGFTADNKPGEPGYFSLSLMFATPEYIWTLSPVGDALKFGENQFVAIGSGADVAYGIAYAMERAGQEPQAIIAEAVAGAIELNRTCGGKVQLDCLKPRN